MKKSFGRNLILFVLIVMFTLCMAVGCTTLSAAPVADTEVTYNDESSITITQGQDILSGAKDSQFELNFEIKMKNDDDHARKWGSIDFYLASNKPEIWDLGTFSNGKAYQFEDGSPFDDATRYTTAVTLHEDMDGGHETGFLHFSMTAVYDRAIEATNDVKFSIVLKLNQDISIEGAGVTANFLLNKAPYNSIGSYIYSGTQENGKFDALHSGDKNKGWNVDGSSAEVSITEINDVANLAELSITDTTLEEGNQTITFIEGTADKTTRPFTYESVNAAKDSILLNVEPANSGAQIEVTLGELKSDDPADGVVAGSTGIIYPKKAGNIVGHKVSLSKAHQIVHIYVQSPNNASTLVYTIVFHQSYIGLDKFDVQTNNKVEGVNKEGMSAETPFDPDSTEYVMYAPVGANGATKVDITPAVAAGYGANTTYSVSGTGISGTLNFRSGFVHSYNIPNASGLKGGEEFDLEYKFIGAKGNEKTVNLKIIAVSVDTTLSSVHLNNDESNPSSAVDLVLGADGKYVSELLKEADYRSLISFVPSAGDKAKAYLYQNNELLGSSGMSVGVAEDNIDSTYDKNEVFNYEIVVTAEAGNVTRYPLTLTKRIVSGKIVSIDYSTEQMTGGAGFDWTKAVEFNKNEHGFDPESTETSQILTLNLPDFLVSRVAFRIKVTDGADIRTVGLANRVMLESATNRKDKYASYSFAAQYLPQGVTEVDVTTYSSADTTGVGYEYKIRIVRTELKYDITNIALLYRDANGDKQNLITNFADLNSDLDIQKNPDLLPFKLPDIPFSTSEIEMRVYTNGNSTVVYVNGRQISRIANTENSIPGDTVHTYTLQLDPGRETIVEIVSKGTDGIKEDPETDENYTIHLTRAAAKSINTLETLKAYLKKEIRNTETQELELKYIDKDGYPVDDKEKAQLITSFKANTFYYYCEIGEDVSYDYIEIVAEAPKDSGATISGAGERYVSVPAGAEKEFTINVTPENSKLGLGINTYHIFVQSNTPQPSKETEITKIGMLTNQGNMLLKDLTNGIPEDTTTKTNPYKTAVSFSNTSLSIDVHTADKTTAVKIIRISDPQAAIDYNGPSNIEYDDNGLIKLEIGDNLFVITSFAQDGITQGINYFFNIYRNPANPNVDLKSLKVNSAFARQILQPGFNTNIFDYTVSIPANSDYITFEAEANDQIDAVIRLYADGHLLLEEKKALNYTTKYVLPIEQGQSKIFSIEIEADGTKKRYYISTKRQYEFGYLKSINVDVADSTTGIIRPIMSENANFGVITNDNLDAAIKEGGVRDFFVYVPYDTDSVTFSATAPDSMRLSFGGSQTFDIKEIFGDKADTHTFPFTVSNGMPNGIDEPYTFNIVRELPRTALTLEEIENFVVSEIADFKLDMNTANYKFTVPYTTKTFTEVIKFKDANFQPSYKVIINGVEVVKDSEGKEIRPDLICGLNNIQVIFTASNKVNTRIITFAVERKHASVSGVAFTDTATNSAITTDVTIVDGIDSYSFSVLNNVESLNLNLSLEEGYTMGAITGNTGFKVGETNKISVEIKDASGAVVRTLIFNVYRDKADADYTVWYIVAGVLGGVALILLILTIVGFTVGSGRKNKRGGNVNDHGVGDFAID